MIDEKGITLPVTIVTAILALAAILASVLIYNVISDNTDDIAAINPILDAIEPLDAIAPIAASIPSEVDAISEDGVPEDTTSEVDAISEDTTSEDGMLPLTLGELSFTFGASQISRLSTGSRYACVVLANGNVACWGDNQNMHFHPTVYALATPVTVPGIGGSNGATQVSIGSQFICVLLTDGTIRCWGNNTNGRLGDGTRTARTTPVQVRGINTAVQISAGISHSCALLTDGTVWCWGTNYDGQLGDGTRTARTTPVQVRGINTAVQISAGRSHSCALLENKSVKCWGANEVGQLGDGTTASRRTAPVQVVGIDGTAGDNTKATQISAGTEYTCAVLTDGTVECWGNERVYSGGQHITTKRLTPIPIMGISESNGATQVSVGWLHICAVLRDETVKCWGLNNLGQLGDGTTTSSRSPVTVLGISEANGATEVSVGGGFTCAVLTDRTVECWGTNEDGQLGRGTRPTEFTSTSSTVTQVSTGDKFTCALSTDGTIRCWGIHSITVSRRGGLKTTQVSAGSVHTCAVLRDGTVECWGNNYTGQLGDGTNTHRRTPVTVSGINTATQVSAGGGGFLFAHSCAVLTDGTVWCWGSNEDGQLGDGTTINRTTPVQVVGIGGTNGATQVSAGGHSYGGHTCALLTDGTIRCWGDNGGRQLGDRTRFRISPTLVTVSGISGSNGATQISAGAAHTCALLTDGTIRCWGIDSITVSRIGGLKAIQVSAGNRFSCAVLTDGTVWCWGSNFSEELGDGTTTNRRTPVRVRGISESNGATQVSVSLGDEGSYPDNHACAALADGNFHCWGSNRFDQLGPHPDAYSTTPAPVIAVST